MQDGWTIRPTTPHIEAIKLEDDEFSIDFNTSLLQVVIFHEKIQIFLACSFLSACAIAVLFHFALFKAHNDVFKIF